MHNHEPAGYKCPMCLLASGEGSEYNKLDDVVYQDERILAYIAPKWWVNNPGNVIVVPKEHIENIYDIDSVTLSEVYALGKRIAIAMKTSYGCDGVSFRQHNEPAGNQNVWHFHLHVFPRWEGDDLYQNHDKKRWVTEEEKKPYAEKLRAALVDL